MLAGLGSSPLSTGHWPGWRLLRHLNSGWAGLLMPSSAPPQCFQLSLPRKNGGCGYVYKVPPPHLYHSLPPIPPPSCSLPVPPLLPILLVSVCTEGAGDPAAANGRFHVTGLVLGVSGLPSSCFLKPCQVPGLLGAQGRNSPDASKGLPSPLYFFSTPPPKASHDHPGPDKLCPHGRLQLGGA